MTKNVHLNSRCTQIRDASDKYIVKYFDTLHIFAVVGPPYGFSERAVRLTHSQLLVLGLRRVLHGPSLPVTPESSCRDQGPSSAQ